MSQHEIDGKGFYREDLWWSGQTRVQRPELAGKMRVGPRSVVGDRSGTRALRSVQKVGKPPF